MDRAELKSRAKEQMKGKGGTLALITLIHMAISAAMSSIPAVGVVSIILTAPLYFGIVMIAIGITYGDTPKVQDLFKGFSHFSPSLILYLLQYLYTFLWMLLFIIPGIIKTYAYSMAFFILADNPNMSASDCLKESARLMKGHKMEYFILGLSFFGWSLLGALTFGILYLWILPYIWVTQANFYQKLKEQDAANNAAYGEAMANEAAGEASPAAQAVNTADTADSNSVQ